ncbi:MAG: glycosyltransferase family 39 protein [Vicinamibacterales bacterium]
MPIAPPTAPPTARSWSRVALPAILGVAAALRLFHLGKESFWLDEAFSVSIAKTTLRHIVDETSIDVHPPLYYFLLHYWLGWLGTLDATARGLSVVFNLGTIVATYFVGRRLFDRPSALAAAGLLACSVFQIEFSQEARMYTLLALLGTLSTYCLLRWFERVSTSTPFRTHAPWLVAYVLATVPMTYTHAYSAFLIAAHAVIVALESLRRPEGRVRLAAEWCAAQVVVALAFIPWLSVFAGQFSHVQQGFWIPKTLPSMLFWPLLTYAGSASLVAIVASLAVWGAATSWGRAAANSGPPPLAVLLPWLAAPIVCPWVLSFIGSPIFLPKYTIAASVPFALLAGRGMARLPNGRWRLAALALLAGLTATPLHTYYTSERKDGWRKAVANIEAAAMPGDAVVTYPSFNQIPYDIYSRRPDLVKLVLPRDAGSDSDAALALVLRERLTPHRRAWVVVLQWDPHKPLIVEELGKLYPRVTRIREWHIDVYLCEPEQQTAGGTGPLAAPPGAGR